MLTHLDVHNYTLVDTLNLELHQGLTTLTGETGAGKSLLLDAIGLAIGNRSRGDAILDPENNAEVCATFDISANASAQQWLSTQSIDNTDDECLLKRIITPSGRSRCFINGRTVTLSQLQSLGHMLVSIYGQHEHQALLSNKTQRNLLDYYSANLHTKQNKSTQSAYPLEHVSASYKEWRNTVNAIETLKKQSDALTAQYELLSYQVEELNQLALGSDEVKTLEKQQKEVSQAQASKDFCLQAIHCTQESDENIQGLLFRTLDALNKTGIHSGPIEEATELLKTALINTEEATRTLESWLESGTGEELNLEAIEARLSEIYTIARKHKVSPNELHTHHQALITALEKLTPSDESLSALEAKLAEIELTYHTHAKALSKVRRHAANKLSKAINKQLHALSMANANFEIALSEKTEPNQYGNESIQFLISTIPGKEPGLISKIASGGELSRISLAIQVEAASSQTVPSLVFDEVDAGIGGSTGNIVGKLLRELGSGTQVLCVTHLAQVASKAHNHLKVSKTTSKRSIRSTIDSLKGQAIVEEVARMLGGPEGTNTSIEHAKEMLLAD